LTKKSHNETKLVQEQMKEEHQENWTRENIEMEIECPRCKDVMTLCSTFNSFCYVCNHCSFCLFTSRTE